MSGNYKELKNCTASETPFIPHAELVCLLPPFRVYSLFAKLVVISPCTSSLCILALGEYKEAQEI